MEYYATDKKNETVLQGLRVKGPQNVLSKKQTNNEATVSYNMLLFEVWSLRMDVKICVGAELAGGTNQEETW